VDPRSRRGWAATSFGTSAQVTSGQPPRGRLEPYFASNHSVFLNSRRLATKRESSVSWKTGVLSSGVDTGELFGLMELRERVFYETVVD
jgi:hypothetical protein